MRKLRNDNKYNFLIYYQNFIDLAHKSNCGQKEKTEYHIIKRKEFVNLYL